MDELNQEELAFLEKNDLGLDSYEQLSRTVEFLIDELQSKGITDSEENEYGTLLVNILNKIPGYEATYEFYVLARRYCHFIEEHEIDYESLDKLMELLMRLYAAALHLPDFKTYLTHDFMQVFPEVKIRVPDSYWEVFDPMDKGKTPSGQDIVGCDLLDDLTAVWSGMMGGIEWYDKGRREDAVVEWKRGLDTYWGKHATDAIRALHALRTA